MKNWNSIAPCLDCGITIDRHSVLHKYCKPCSEKRAQGNKNRWNQKMRAKNRVSVNAKAREIHHELRGLYKQEGAKLSESRSFGDLFQAPKLQWATTIAMPFNYTVSKNYIYGMNGWHVYKREQGKKYASDLIMQIKGALAAAPYRVRQAKVWLAIHVEKPNHKGDAVNVVDAVCDALKKAIGLDDRWFCLRQVDWSINKNNPQLFIQIGQELVTDMIACSHCGRVKEIHEFNRHKGNPFDRSRCCRECSKAASKARKTASSPLSKQAA